MILVKILGVGTGDDSTIGMVDGDLLWSSQVKAGYLDGVIDVNSIDSITSMCNIVEGGELGGLTSSLNIQGISSNLASMVDAGTISLANKYILVYYNEVLVYTGKVSTSFALDQITTQINVDPAYTLDNSAPVAVTVTEEMALYNSKSSAIGKVLTPVYGNKGLFPLVYCDPALNYTQTMVETAVVDDGQNYLYTFAPHLFGSNNPTMSSDGVYKGLSLLQVAGMYQQTEDKTPIWVCLSVNGKHSLFDVGAVAHMEKIRVAFLGRTLIGVQGTGKDSYFTITDIEYATHNDHADVWLELDTTDSGSVTSSIPWIDGYEENASGNGLYRVRVNEDHLSASTIFQGGYEDNKIKEDITFLSFCSPNNLFLVHGDCTFNTPAKLYTKTDDIVTELDNIKVTEIYSGENWKLISIFSDNFNANEKVITDTNISPFVTYIYEDYDTFNGSTVNNNGTVTSDGFSIGQPISPWVLTTKTVDGGENPYVVNTHNTMFIPVDGTVNGLSDLTDLSLSIVPDCSISVNGGFWGMMVMHLYINVDVVTEGNVVMGSSSLSLPIKWNKPNKKNPTDDMRITIDPMNEVVLFSDGVLTYEQSSAECFRSIKSQLDLSDKIDVGDINKICGFFVTVRTEVTGAFEGWLINTNMVIDKIIARPCAIISKKYNFDSLFIESNITSITSPASLIKSIAEAHGITCNADSFAACNAKYVSFQSIPYSGYYTASSSETVSTILRNISQMAGIGLYTSADGVLYCTQLLEYPSEYNYSFTGYNLIDSSFLLNYASLPCTAYSFKVSTPLVGISEVQLLTSNQEFPAEDEYKLGEIVYTLANEWDLYVKADTSTKLTIRARSNFDKLPLLYGFTVGTMWRVTTETGIYDCKLESTGIDPSVTNSICGIILGLRKITTLSTTGGTKSMVMRSPLPKWKEFVNGVIINDYITAKALYDRAKDAYILLGKSNARSNQYTELTQPIFGNDISAIQKWMYYGVDTSAKYKVTASFSTPMSDSIMALPLLSYVSLSWGKFYNTPVHGYIVKKQLNFAQGTIDFTVVLSDIEQTGLNYIITENSLPILTEGGGGIIIESGDPETGTKISDMDASNIASLITAGGVVPVAVEDINNFKVTISDIENYAIDISKAYTDTKLSSIKQVFYVGNVGDTSITFAHGMSSSDIIVSVYNRVDSTSRWVPVDFTVDETNIYVTDLTPLEANLKFVILS